MRRPRLPSTFGLSLAATIGTTVSAAIGAGLLATPAQARVASPAPSASVEARAELVCKTSVTGVDSENRLVYYTVRNDLVIERRSSRPLGFRPANLGYLGTDYTSTGSTTRMTATTADGVPRELSVVERDDSRTLQFSATTFGQKNYRPRLFTDAYSYFGYTINHVGVLQRWTLVRLRTGQLSYRYPVTVATNLKNTVAITPASLKSQPSADILYTTTKLGALRLLTVPHERPEDRSFRTLSARGYAGVTELSGSYCNGKDRGVVIGIDPTAGTATWTVVTDVSSPARARSDLKGAIRRQVDWNLHATL